DVISDAALREIATYLSARRAGKPPARDLGKVTPLFPSATAVLPISFMRDDGVLITRGAGRVRGRHELEGTYGPFHSFYFEDRSYGFLIEDYTPRGESRIRVTYLPVARPEDKTNFRAFKIYGNGNVFHANTGMDSDVPLPSLKLGGVEHATRYTDEIAPYARTQSHQVTSNARTGKPLVRGDMFEFEFGVFIDPAAVSANSRTSYYTDTFRYRVGQGGLTPENADTSGKPGPSAHAELGGDTTLAWAYAEPETYFSQLALNVQHEHVQPFMEGRRLFHTDFGTGAHSEAGNPALMEQAGKLGPLFVARACTTCHVGNGGGRAMTGTLDEKSSLAFKLEAAAGLGKQLQLQEGSARAMAGAQRSVSLGDGSSVMLSRPTFEVKSKAGQALPNSARIARRLVGLGLLEAISEESLIAQADPDDCDGDGVSGRAHFVSDPVSGVLRIGRFGWRAEKVSIEHQVADAAAEDLGVQSRMIPGGGAELSDHDLARLSAYMRLLGVPPQRDAEDPAVAQGEQLFRSVGCGSCHLAAMTTGQTHPFVELRGQQIRPYTDLLLHDLGPDLADDSGVRADGSDGSTPGASEWRTAPLWGLGLSRTVQGYLALLHDGRAASVVEAVLWHGGEAGAARGRFERLSAEEREALVRFVESL
ncbi:MAG TPA: di-heme oxidoredictase family protein, partial [Polyangiales bacterium]